MAPQALNTDKLDHMVLPILGPTLQDTNRGRKGIGWSISGRLHAKGQGHDSDGKARSPCLTEAGPARGEVALVGMFTKQRATPTQGAEP